MNSATCPDLPPLDPNASTAADADRERQKRYLRKRLAEGSLSPSRRRLMENELRLVQAAGRGDG